MQSQVLHKNPHGGFYGELGSATDNAGYVKIFENVNGNFTQVGDALTGDNTNNDEFGFSVDLSSDGSIAAVSSAQGGDVFVYQRNGNNWSQLRPIITISLVDKNITTLCRTYCSNGTIRG